MVSPGMPVVHDEYRGGADLAHIGLLAMCRWRLIELERSGEQHVSPRQLMDMCVTAMMTKRDRSLSTPLGYLYQHTNERAEKLNASRAMAIRCQRGETTDWDRLRVRLLLFPLVSEILDKYGEHSEAPEPRHLPPEESRSPRRDAGQSWSATRVEALEAKIDALANEIRQLAKVVARQQRTAHGEASGAAQEPP